MSVYLQSRLGVMRVGASRLNTASGYSVMLAGVRHTNNVDQHSINVEDQLDERADTMTFECIGITPAEGDTVKFDDRGEIQFAGSITNVKIRHRKLNDRAVWRCTATDYSYELDGVLVTKHYTGKSASYIARDLLSLAPAGFTGAHIAAGLPTVDEIQFTMTPLMQALRQLCDAIGGDCYVDYAKDVHVFLTESDATPATLQTSNSDWRDFEYEKDIKNLINRVYVECRGSSTSNNAGAEATTTGGVKAGSTQMSVLDSSPFPASGGQLLTGDGQVLSHTGVTNLAAPSSAPTVAIAHSSTTKSASFSRSGTTVTATVTGHGYATGATLLITASSPTDYNGRYTITVTGANTFTFQIGTTPANGNGTVQVATSGSLIGTYSYKVAFASVSGETLASAASSTATVAQVANDNGTFAVTPTTGGSLTSSIIYRHGGTAVTALGETALVFERTANLGASDTAVSITSWSGAPYDDVRVISKRLYRRKNSEFYPTDDKLVVTLDNSVTSYTDKSADGTLGQAALTENRAGGGGVMLTAVPTSSDARVTSRKIYRKESGESVWRLVGTINDNTSTTFTDTTAASALGTEEPATSTFPGLLTGIPASGAGSITSDLKNGETVSALVQVDDASSQATYARTRSEYSPDQRLTTTSGTVRANSVLTLKKSALKSGQYTTTDQKVRSGRRVTVSMSSAWGISATFKIIQVRKFYEPGRTKLQRTVSFGDQATTTDLYRILRGLQRVQEQAL